ncbi:phosphoenolpyruvate carboxykinase 1 [Actinidia rufa]|uniref:Phosphoenolpyruvate carboxykinase 1 n=1 Tax=Actinidia rufa TaxID=165716 RepID=A0A7J0DV31_9ERIC|nr:phosphoenolpyruvate carboxykinase 1 [Actinidia rufa]
MWAKMEMSPSSLDSQNPGLFSDSDDLNSDEASPDLEGAHRPSPGSDEPQSGYSLSAKTHDMAALSPDALSMLRPTIWTIDEYLQYREKQRLVQFLMALRDQFESLRGAILHRSPLPSMDGVVHELIAKETRLKVNHISPPTQSVTSKPKPQIPLDECSYCQQKGHWKYSCPNWGQSRGQKDFSRSSSSSRASQQYSQHGIQQHSRSFTALAAPTSSDTSLLPSFVEFQQFQQYRAFMATIQGDSTHASDIFFLSHCITLV